MAKQKPTPKKQKKVTYLTPVEHVKHRDKRVNIPTEELQGFIAEAENSPKKVLYHRDPSLAPQLVWNGKNGQVAKTLWIPAVNNHGGYGRWAFIEIEDSWDAVTSIERELKLTNP